MYKIRFVIGDHSHDGHGRKEVFIVSSNKSGQDVVDLHRLCKSKLGFDISDILSDYNKNIISSKILLILLQHNIIKQDDVLIEELIEEAEEYQIKDFELNITKIEELYSKFYYDLETVNQSYVLNLWFNILKYLDPNLTLKIIQERDIFKLDSYVGSPGYGLFS